MEIQAPSATNLFYQACKKLYEQGTVTEPRGEKVIELNNFSFILTNPYDNVVKTSERNISIKYLLAEWLWYCSARQDKKGADFISQYAKFWNRIRNDDGSLNSNYGFYFFEPMNLVFPVTNPNWYYTHKSQFDFVCDTLLEDNDSRQAIVNINNTSHKKEATKDFPCTLGMQFFIRDGRLDVTVIMRSTDVVLGFCNDIFQFSMFQSVVLNRLKQKIPNLRMGILTLFTGSLHVYERHWDMLGRVVNSKNKILRELPEIPFKNMTYEAFIDILKGNTTKRAIKASNFINKWMLEKKESN